jgi:hypothetical protein
MEPTQQTNESTDHAPRKLTFAQNVILTVKVLGGAALILAALWGANQWTSTY